MDSFTITLTAEQMAAALAQAASQGIELDPSIGRLPESHGVQCSYIVGPPAAGTVLVTVSILKKPLFVSVGMVQGAVRKMLGV